MEAQSFFNLNQNTTAADVDSAIAPIEALLYGKITKVIFRDLLRGFKILLNDIQKSNAMAYEILVKWLNLYLCIENALDPDDGKLREQFEKYIPATMSYIVAALQYLPNNVVQYHYQLLDASIKLLETVKESTLEAVANLDTGLIACLWFPIDFVGDFNTQMVAFRLMIMLLKCVDATKQHDELEKICTAQKRALKDNICNAIKVSNYQTDKFENTARNLLNNYNMNLSKNVLVYSMRCKSVNFGKDIVFKKALNTQYLWIDLNYCPRTITFNARYRSSIKEKFVNLGVCLQISKLSLCERTLSIDLDTPPKLSINFSQPCINDIRHIKIELLLEEALRLKENHLVLEYYNKASARTEAASVEHTTDNVDIDNADIVEHPSNGVSVLNTTPTEFNVQNAAHNSFQKSYSFLIGHSGERVTSNNQEILNNGDSFKIPSLHTFKKALHTSKQVEPTEATQTCFNVEEDTNSAFNIMDESPKTSRAAVDKQNTSQDIHPIAKLSKSKNIKRRYLRSANENSSDIEEYQLSLNTKLTRTSAKKSVDNCSKLLTSPPKIKKVNEVKPMNHSAKNDDAPNETIVATGGGIVNITNFLCDGNESAAVYNEAQRRTILHNVERIDESLKEHKAYNAIDNTKNVTSNVDSSAVVDDIYDNPNVSDAEPCQSYRNFKVRRPKKVDNQLKSAKPKRIRKAVTKKTNGKKQTHDDACEPSTSKAAECVGRRTRKRTARSTVIENILPKNTHVIESEIVLKKPRKTAYSQKKSVVPDIEIDLTDGENHSVQSWHPNNNSNRKATGINFKNPTLNATIKRTTTPKLLTESNGIYIITSSLSENSDDDRNIATAGISKCRQDAAVFKDDEISLSSDKCVSKEINTPNVSDGMNISDTDDESPIISKYIRSLDTELHNKVNSGIIEDISMNTSVQTATNPCNGTRDVTLNECILFHARSDSELTDESDEESVSNGMPAENLYITPINAVSIRNLPTTSVTNSTIQTMPISQPTVQSCKLTTSITTHQTISQDLFLMPSTSTAASISNNKTFNARTIQSETSLLLAKFTDINNTTTCLTPLSQRHNPIDAVYSPLKNDISLTAVNFKETMKLELNKVHKDSKQSMHLNSLIRKVEEISERLLLEAQRQRSDVKESEKQIEKLMRQLSWQWDMFKTKTERFNCFKKNMELFFDALGNIDLSTDINDEFNNTLTTLRQVGNHIRSTQWQEYIEETKMNFVKNIFTISEL